jgi:hypothetical protein
MIHRLVPAVGKTNGCKTDKKAREICCGFIKTDS